jgi:hypothetical protein
MFKILFGFILGIIFSVFTTLAAFIGVALAISTGDTTPEKKTDSTKSGIDYH